jgi:hypothetical protein
MPTYDAETKLLIFKAFLLGNSVTMKAFDVQGTAAADRSLGVLRRVADGAQTLLPEIESMLTIVPAADKPAWRKRFEDRRPAREAEARELARAAIEGMTEFLRIE